jgi:hypothetical protein
MASIRKTKLSPYWQAVLTLADGTRTNRSTRQTHKKKAKEVADEMARTINAARQGMLSREKLLGTFNDLMARVGEGRLPKVATASMGRSGSRKSENDMLAELHRRLGRDKSSGQA